MKRNRLIELRGDRSQEEVAKALGITRQALSAIELGKRSPSLRLAKRIAEYYGVSIDDISVEFFDAENGHKTLHDNTA